MKGKLFLKEEKLMRQFFCILCSWFVFEKNTIFCSHCEKKVKALIEKPKIRMEGKTKHYYLFSWGSKNDTLCRDLIYFLKEKPEAFFSVFATSFKSLKIKENSTFVCPYSQRRVNQAKSFASSVSKLFKSSSVYEIEAVIEEARPQKHLSRKERLEKIKKKISPSAPLSKWVFVDDVLVTGSTYYTVYESVGQSPQAIFTVFYKELVYSDKEESR